MILTKEQLLGLTPRVEPVEIAGVGTAYVRELNGEDLEAVTNSLSGERVSLTLVVGKSLADQQGQRLFGDDDLASVKRLPANVLKRIFDKAVDLNGLSADAIEEETKNS